MNSSRRADVLASRRRIGSAGARPEPGRRCYERVHPIPFSGRPRPVRRKLPYRRSRGREPRFAGAASDRRTWRLRCVGHSIVLLPPTELTFGDSAARSCRVKTANGRSQDGSGVRSGVLRGEPSRFQNHRVLDAPLHWPRLTSSICSRTFLLGARRGRAPPRGRCTRSVGECFPAWPPHRPSRSQPLEQQHRFAAPLERTSVELDQVN